MLSESELRVLGYLPSNLSAPEIAAELSVSTSTVKTHMRQIYAKFDVHKRTDAVQRARDLGLLGRSTRAPRPANQLSRRSAGGRAEAKLIRSGRCGLTRSRATLCS
jgi:DNA-binding CsgD family transcriptional regulator